MRAGLKTKFYPFVFVGRSLAFNFSLKSLTLKELIFRTFYMETFFKKLSKPSNLLGLFSLFVLFNILLKRFMPKNLALDIRFAYSANEAYDLIRIMGESTREKYLIVIWTLDTPYMFIYFLLLLGLVSKILKQKKFLVLPFVIVGLDFFENVFVSSLLVSFPLENQFLGYFASFFTTTKWLFVGLCMAFLVIGLIRNYVLKNQPNLDRKG